MGASDASNFGHVAIHQWLGGPYARYVQRMRWSILVFSTLAIMFFFWRASMLTLPTGRPTVWRASSNMHKYYDLVRLHACLLVCASAFLATACLWMLASYRSGAVRLICHAALVRCL